MNPTDRWIFIGLALLGGLIGGAVSARIVSPSVARETRTVPSQVWTERLVLVDSGGMKVAELAPTWFGGGATFTIYDHTQATVTLYSLGGVSGLAMADYEGKMRVALDTESDGSPLLNFYDGRGAISRKLP